MDVTNSHRYEEAVQRLKKLLYEDVHTPSWDHYDTTETASRGRYDSDYPVTNLGFHSTKLSSKKGHSTAVTAGHYSESARDAKISATDGGRKITYTSEGTSHWLLELLHRQEDLIVQLEKENEFLKRELLSVGDNVGKMAKENQDLSRKLANALAQVIASQDESSESGSCISNASQDEKPRESLLHLQRGNEKLRSDLERVQSALDAANEREQAALNKLREALSLAEDTQSLTAQVRAGSESALAELSNILTATKEGENELKRLLDETDQKLRQQQEHQDQWRAQQQQRIELLEDQISDQNVMVDQLHNDVRERDRRIAALKEDLQASQAAKSRMETQLEDQRLHAKEAHARLENIIATRSADATAATAQARELEDRLTTARQDINRLLQTITNLAQGTRKIGDLDTTDDIKSERLAAEQQLNTMLNALQSRHEEEIRTVQSTATQNNQAMDTLRNELAALRQQLAEDNEKSSRERERQKEELDELHAHLQQTQQEIVREQQQAQIHGALYQQALEKLKKSESALTGEQQKNHELVDLVREANGHRNSLQQEVTLLTKALKAATAKSATDAVSEVLVSTMHERPLQQNGDKQQQVENRNEEYVMSVAPLDAAVLANDKIFKNVVVAPGVTLFHMYQ